MPTSASATTYNFNLTLRRLDNSANEGALVAFTSACGMTDELAISLANLFLAIPVPQGTVAEAWVTRHQTNETQSEADLANGVFI